MRCTALAAAALIGLTIAGCASGTGSTGGDDSKPSAGPASVADWYTQGGTALTQQIGSDLTAISAAAPDAGRMAPACAQLATDTTAARNYPQIPDGPAQQHWARALDDLGATATACTAGDTAAADRDIRKASLEMHALTGRVNSLGNV